MTIYRSVVLVLLSASFLTACNPSTTNNHNTYETGKAGMSGGGATKDPGNGTGGGDSGGGGQGVRCSETKNPKLSNRLFVRDIYEAINNHNLQLKFIPNDIPGTDVVSSEAIQVLNKSLKEFFGPAMFKMEFGTEKFWADFTQKISFIDDEKELFPSQDANSPIALPKGCKIVQIAYWDESAGSSEDGTLYVNKNLWSALDQTNKIGLLAHEYFFKLARKAQYKNSDAIRNKIGHLLSTEGLLPLFKGWHPTSDTRVAELLPKTKKGFKICEGTSSADSTAKVLLFQYEGIDNLQHLSIPLLRSNSINSNPFQNSNFSFDPRIDISLNAATDLLLYQTTKPVNNVPILFRRKFSKWINRWYNENEVLLTKGITDNATQGFREASEVLELKNPILWTDYLTPASKTIQVSLLNPSIKDKSKKVLKTRDDLVAAVYTKLTESFSECTIKRSRKSQDPHHIESALTILHKEVTNGLATGQYPLGFPLWIGALKAYENAYLNGEQSLPEKCQLQKSEETSTLLPELLYKLSLNIYSETDVEETLGVYAFYPKDDVTLGFGRLQVSQDSTVLNFDLKCKDYNTVYMEATQKNQTEDRPLALVTNKEVNIKLLEVPPKEKNDTALNEEEKKEALKDKELQEKEHEQLQKFAEFLRFKASADTDLEFKKMENSIMAYYPQAVEGKSQLMQSHFKHFMESIRTETKITVSPCETGITYESAGWETFTCAIVKTESQNHTYELYFAPENSGRPCIVFIKYRP